MKYASFRWIYFSYTNRESQRELEVLSGFIINERNLNDIRYVNYTWLMLETQTTIQELPVKQSGKNQTNHCKIRMYGCKQGE